MNEKYIKIVYQSEPIGKERIVLYLTTFDIEAFERDNLLIKKQEKIVCEIEKADLTNPDFLVGLEKNLNTMVKEYYGYELERLRKIKNVKNITNSNDVHCNIVYGNITNCDNIYCNEIKGNVVNCDQIIYKK